MSGFIERYCSRMSQPSLLILGLFSILLFGFLDWITGPKFGFFLFYLFPVIAFTYAGGLSVGIVLSLTAACAWFAIDFVSNPIAELPITFWNALIRGGTFLLVSYIFWGFHSYRRRQEELMSYVVHDLRSPITNILLSLDVLETQGPINEGQARILATGRVSARRLSLLVDALLDLSHLERGKARIRPMAVKIDELLREAITDVSVWAKKNDIQIQYIVPPSVTTCWADRSLLLRVLVNLLSNAIKLSPAGSAVSVDISSRDGQVCFCVSDNGPGFPKEDLKRLLKKSGLPISKTGNGFGLKFCKLAIEAQGGRLLVDSEEGKGAKVSFTLPAARAA